jgi:hypothetical protein
MREAIALESRSQSGRPLAWREHGVSLAAVTIILEFSWHSTVDRSAVAQRVWNSCGPVNMGPAGGILQVWFERRLYSIWLFPKSVLLSAVHV